MIERPDTTADPSVQANDVPPRVPSLDAWSGTAVRPQAGGAACGCGAASASSINDIGEVSYVYAIGQVEARFPSLSAEKEFAQATTRTETSRKTDQQTFHAVLSKPENRYLVRQLCWVLTIQGLETYLLVPHDAADIDLLVEAIRPVPTPNDIDVVIGVLGGIAPPTMCNGLMVPIVTFDQLYSFDRETLITAVRTELTRTVAKSEKATAAELDSAAEELFNRIIQVTDNAGSTDEHRALNYLAMRCPTIYAQAAEKFRQACS